MLGIVKRHVRTERENRAVIRYRELEAAISGDHFIFMYKVVIRISKGSSMSFYSDFTLILSRFYPDFILILSRFYPDFLKTHFIQILSRFYPNF